MEYYKGEMEKGKGSIGASKCSGGVTKQVIFAGVRTDVNELMQAIIHTELNVCIDSDDCLAIDAVEKIIKKWERVCDKGYVDCIHYCSSSQIAKK